MSSSLSIYAISHFPQVIFHRNIDSFLHFRKLYTYIQRKVKKIQTHFETSFGMVLQRTFYSELNFTTLFPRIFWIHLKNQRIISIWAQTFVLMSHHKA